MNLIPPKILGFNTRKLIAAFGALVIFAVLAKVAMDTDAWQSGNETANATTDANDMDGLVTALFDDHVIALEVLGVLLTAAMIGALVIARPLGAPDDSTHYGVQPAAADEEEE